MHTNMPEKEWNKNIHLIIFLGCQKIKMRVGKTLKKTYTSYTVKNCNGITFTKQLTNIDLFFYHYQYDLMCIIGISSSV